MTIAELVHETARQLEAAGIDDARLEAEVLLSASLDVDRTRLLSRLREAVPDDTARRLQAFMTRRLGHEPLAYIVGHREFYALDLICAPGALIPRPETEMLVDLALDEARRRGGEIRVADVGTGSGAVAVAVAANAPSARVVAIDVSRDALDVARRNIERYSLERRIELRCGDLLENEGTHDLILANLPYVAEGSWRTLPPEIREREPRMALVGGAAGSEVISRLLAHAPSHLSRGGVLAAEIGETQGQEVLAAAACAFPCGQTRVETDAAGRDRMLVVRT